LTKHQKLSLVRTHSTFSFEDLTKLNIKEMTYYRKRTPSERELIAKKLRNSSLGKRKPRRAIRRKQTNANKTDLTISEMGTGTVGSPNVKSAAGSICEGSICGGISIIPGGGSGDDEENVISSLPPDDTDNPICKQPPLASSSSSPRPSSSKDDNPSSKSKLKKQSKDSVTIEGKKKDKASSSSSSKVKKSSKVSGSGKVLVGSGVSVPSSSGHSSASTIKPIVGGKRVSGRVKTVSEKNRNRFILETDEPEHGGTLGDTIFSLLGLRMTLGEEMRRLGSMAGSPQGDSKQSLSQTPPAYSDSNHLSSLGGTV
jgi:hypothetical protein